MKKYIVRVVSICRRKNSKQITRNNVTNLILIIIIQIIISISWLFNNVTTTTTTTTTTTMIMMKTKQHQQKLMQKQQHYLPLAFVIIPIKVYNSVQTRQQQIHHSLPCKFHCMNTINNYYKTNSNPFVILSSALRSKTEKKLDTTTITTIHSTTTATKTTTTAILDSSTSIDTINNNNNNNNNGTLDHADKNDTTNDRKGETTVIVSTSKVLGKICQLQLNNSTTKTKNDNSFVTAMGVPTYKCLDDDTTNQLLFVTTNNNDEQLNNNTNTNTNNHNNSSSSDDTTSTSCKIIHSINNICSPTILIYNVLSNNMCNDILHSCNDLIQQFNIGKNNHGAVQLIVSSNITNYIEQQIIPYINISQVQDRHYELFNIVSQQKQHQDQKQEQSTTTNSTSTNQLQHITSNNSNTTNNSTLKFMGINRRWRLYRYMPGGIESFSPHIDAGFPPSGIISTTTSTTNTITSSSGFDDNDTTATTTGSTVTTDEFVWDISNGTIVSRLTLLLYLNDNFINGETIFYNTINTTTATSTTSTNTDTNDTILTKIKPVTGSCLLFPQVVPGTHDIDTDTIMSYARTHWPLHEGSSVHSDSIQPKYVIRSDVLFTSS